MNEISRSRVFNLPWVRFCAAMGTAAYRLVVNQGESQVWIRNDGSVLAAVWWTPDWVQVIRIENGAGGTPWPVEA